MCFQKENNILSISTDFHTIKAKIMDTGEWIEGFVIKKQEFFYLYETLPSGSIGQNIYEIIPATIC